MEVENLRLTRVISVAFRAITKAGKFGCRFREMGYGAVYGSVNGPPCKCPARNCTLMWLVSRRARFGVVTEH